MCYNYRILQNKYTDSNICRSYYIRYMKGNRAFHRETAIRNPYRLHKMKKVGSFRNYGIS